MDLIAKESSDRVNCTNAAVTPNGKSARSSSCEDVHDLDHLNSIQLELESADLELRAADAMKRAAEAKRRAAAALLRQKCGTRDEVKLDEDVFTKLSILDDNLDIESKVKAGPDIKHEDSISFDTSMNRLLARLELPKFEMPMFDGSPLHYILFIRQFESQVESRVQDDGQRLSYLYQYCQGKAREAIKGCLLYPAHEGYRRARSVLKDLFGQRHLIVRAMLDDVTSPGSVPQEAEALSSFANRLVNCADALEQLGFIADLNSISTIEKVLDKLPRSMAIEWVKKADEIYQDDREPVFRDLCEFVSVRARVQRNRYSYLLRDRKKESERHERQNTYKRTYVVSVGGNNCVNCKGMHTLDNCKEFVDLDVKDRWALVSRLRLCFVCLKTGHRSNECQSNARCSITNCNRKHHNLLHQPDTKSHILNASGRCSSNSHGVSLGILPVVVEGPNSSVFACALLDTGADTSLIREDLARDLGLDVKQEKVHLSTPIGKATRSCARVSFRLRSLDGNEVTDIKTAYTVPSILDVTASLPSKQVLSKWSHLNDVNFSPLPTPVVGILLGLDNPDVHWILEQRRGKKGEPYADHTPFGWVLRGPLDLANLRKAHVFSVHSGYQELELNLRQMYDHDFQDNGSFETAPSVEDEIAVDIAEKSLICQSGHFRVGLPWKDDELKNCCNRSLASHRLFLLGKRLSKDEGMKKKYSAVIDRYVQKGYAVKSTNKVNTEDCVVWYLPHHAVINPKKPEKVRVVFDCAAKYKGHSLNDHLLQGPNMVSNLVGIVLRFRQRPIALSADIEDMFLQVFVPEQDQNALRFLWWQDGNMLKAPDEFQLTVHPFGAVSSPFCASFALKKTATIFGHNYPVNVSDVVMDSFYVDDCLVSVDNEEEAISLCEDLTQLLKCGGFKLTKWLSNSRRVLNKVPLSDRSTSVKNLNLSALPVQRTLGISWDMETDTFRYELPQDDVVRTRRTLLSRLASIYDPLGWISPFILPMKLLFQELCRKGVGWDEKLDSSTLAKWEQCKQVLMNIERINIPRWYARDTIGVESEIELHVFSDASEVGYGAAAYFRFMCHQSKSRCVLVTAKSRVAPLKSVTIPRMELSAALVAVELARLIVKEIKLTIREITYWTDSAVVLYYLKASKGRFSTFVANRVTKIKEGSSPSQWRHVTSSDNPADICSRGMRLNRNDLQLWLEGPAFLHAPGRIKYDNSDITAPHDDLLEFKSIATIRTTNDDFLTRYFSRFSSWHALLRCITWLRRYKQYLLVLLKGRTDLSIRLGPLTVHEIRASCYEIIRLVQLESFSDVFKSLCDSRIVNTRRSTHNSLRKLSPVLKDGLLCVGGRLQWSDLSEDEKYPAILPNTHFITDRIIRYYHELEGHVGCTQVLATIRKKFWVVRGRAAVRRVLSRCLLCKRESARPCQQQMAPLPRERATFIGHAFAHVGVDYFGPVYVKRGRVEEKRYGCLFTCLNIRAIHIEVVHSLSTDAFIQALVRFMARRGQPKTIFSDNGSNFKGAYRELRNSLQSMSQARINNFLVERDIEWHFGIPEASHWGGVWERMIRTVRRILRAIARGQRMTDETLPTFLAEVERIINNRPLVPLTEDTRDLGVLTPSKLLLLKDNGTLMDSQEFSRSCLRLWRRVQVLADTFWKRWKVEYLSMLQERQVWFDKTRNLKVGDLVLVIDDNTHRSQWPLGLILDVIPGTDGLAREVLVRTSRGNLRRHVRKICFLEGAVS